MPAPSNNPGPTYLAIPGAPAPRQPPATPADGAGWLIACVLCLGLVIVWLGNTRRRSLEPAERAFRRIARERGLARPQIRALRREAAALGLDSPVGLAIGVDPHAERPASRAGKRGGPNSPTQPQDRTRSDTTV